MSKFLKSAVVFLLSVIVIGCLDNGVTAATMKKAVLSSKTTLPGNCEFNVIAEPFDWGKDVTRIMLNPGKSVNGADVKAEDFTVKGKHYSEQAYKDDFNGDRPVINAYPADAEGNKTEDGEYIILELQYGSNVPGAHTGSYSYANFYTPLTLTYTVEWKAVADKYTQHEVVNLVCDEFKLDRYVDNNIEDTNFNFVDYAYYEPKEDTNKNPLIIFFHGMGEGGAGSLNNHGVQMYAYPESNFADTGIQNIMGNAYVLLPQSPVQWPTDGFDNESGYLEVVNGLIDDIIANHPDIDTDRIYVGGLSMGGFMASRVILNRPDKYAAAFLCSQAYAFTDEDAQKLKNLPIWISCSEADGTCKMDSYTYYSYEKLVKAEVKEAKCAVMESNVSDPTSRFRFYSTDKEDFVLYNATQDNVNKNKGDFVWDDAVYSGHNGGWVPVFANGEYYIDDNGKQISIMEWVASKSLVTSISLDTTKAKLSFNVGDAFSSEGLVVNAVKNDGSIAAVTGYTVAPVDTSEAGTFLVNVTYNGLTVSYNISVLGRIMNLPTDKSTTITATPTAQATKSSSGIAVSVTLSDSSAVLCKKGANKIKLSAVVKGSNESVVWSSSDTKVATVNSKGNVTAKSAGDVIIKATVNGISAECRINVKNATFKLAKTKYTVNKGKNVKIKLALSGNKKAKFISGNKKVAKVSSKGIIKGVKKGKTTITIKFLGITQTIKFIVK